MDEAGSYDGYVQQLAATGLTYINPPQQAPVAVAASAVAGAASGSQPWTQAEANRTLLDGLGWGDLNVPHCMFEGEALAYVLRLPAMLPPSLPWSAPESCAALGPQTSLPGATASDARIS